MMVEDEGMDCSVEMVERDIQEVIDNLLERIPQLEVRSRADGECINRRKD